MIVRSFVDCYIHIAKFRSEGSNQDILKEKLQSDLEALIQGTQTIKSIKRSPLSKIAGMSQAKYEV